MDDLSGSQTVDELLFGMGDDGAGLMLRGWADLANGWLVLDMVTVLLIALLLGAAIAYHPSLRRRVTSLDQWEQPKAVLMYALVAAVVALIVQVQPAMALVVFGLGGLLRFRTVVGRAHDTGRVILVTVVGLCCGLKIFVVALPATVVGWLVIYFQERTRVGVIRVTGVEDSALRAAALGYRAIIVEAGCELIGERSKVLKREVSFIVKAPATLDKEALKAQLEQVPEEHRGVVVFEKL